MYLLRGRAVGLTLAGLGIAATIGSLLIGEGLGSGSWGPRMVPLLAAATVLAAGLAEMATAARVAPAIAEGTAPPTDADAGDRRLAFGLFAVALAYAWLMGRIGYMASTALAAPAAFALYGLRRPAVLLAAAILCPLVLHLVFFRLLAAFPPRGRWFDLTDWLPL